MKMCLMFSPRDIVQAGSCIGCGSCVAQAGSPDVQMRFNRYGRLKPARAKGWSGHGSGDFSKTCPFSPAAKNERDLAHHLFPDADKHDATIGRYLAAYVGYVKEDDFRMQGSSGGMVTWMATELLRNGLIDGVAHVVAADPDDGERFFRYQLSRSEDEIRGGAKLRYYPIEPSEILKLISAIPGRYAVVGVPCFIKAVQLLREEDPVFHDRISFTLGLFCGHMKSVRFVESLAWQMDVDPGNVKGVDFRHKDPDRPANWYRAQLTLRDGHVVEKDWWHMAVGDWGQDFL